MKDYVLANFCTAIEHQEILDYELAELGEDFIELRRTDTYDGFVVVEGKLNSCSASVIRLGNSFLSDKMHVSTISEDLKQLYRR